MTNDHQPEIGDQIRVSIPLLTILIATKDRPDDLRRTLHDLRRQDYPFIEMIVIDDGSAKDLEPVVREAWPTAVFVREPESRGCPHRRSEGFQMAKGDFIVELDDDSAPVESDALSLAVSYMSDNPGIGILSFPVFNGPVLPGGYSRPDGRYVCSFVGCGALFRTAAVRSIGGYQTFFEGEWEESEYALRTLSAGWSVYLFPNLLIHHRVSPLQRRLVRAWTRGFRNRLWAMTIHYPAHRAAIEGTWVLAMAAWDAVRLFRPLQFMTGVGQFAGGLPRAIRLRRPMSRQTMRLYDALRFGYVVTEKELRSPPPCGLADLLSHFRRSWLNRPRQRSFWDARSGDMGSSETVRFAHEFVGNASAAKRTTDVADEK